MRRDAPGRAAKAYAEQLRRAIQEDENEDKEGQGDGEVQEEEEEGLKEESQQSAEGEDGEEGNRDTEMPDVDANAESRKTETTRRRPMTRSRAKLEVSLGTEHEAERWRRGEMAEVYEDALRTLLRLQGEGVPGQELDASAEGPDGNALASTLGKAERAGRAVEVVEKKKTKK